MNEKTDKFTAARIRRFSATGMAVQKALPFGEFARALRVRPSIDGSYDHRGFIRAPEVRTDGRQRSA